MASTWLYSRWNGGFHRAVALNVLHMPGAQDHQGGGGQYDSELQRQEQSGFFVPPFRFHFLNGSPGLSALAPQSNIVKRA